MVGAKFTWTQLELSDFQLLTLKCREISSVFEIIQRAGLCYYPLFFYLACGMFQRDPRAGAFLGGDRVSGQDVRDQNGACSSLCPGRGSGTQGYA